MTAQQKEKGKTIVIWFLTLEMFVAQHFRMHLYYTISKYSKQQKTTKLEESKKLSLVGRNAVEEEIQKNEESYKN